jgi:hypothetical protein
MEARFLEAAHPMADGDHLPSTQSPPDWLGDAVRNTAGELRLFAETLWGITVRPMRFAQAWADGTQRALNPLAFLATAASFTAAAMQILGWGQDDVSFGQQVVLAVGPFLPYATAGVLAHVALLGVRPRRRVLDSLAIGLFAGGPALVGYVLVSVGLTVHWLVLGRPHATNGLLSSLSAGAHRTWHALMWLVVASFLRSLWLGLAGLHRGRWVVAGLATVFAIGVLAVLLGTLGRHGPFGFQLAFYWNHGDWNFDLHD